MRLNLTRDFYRPLNRGAVLVKPKAVEAEIYLWEETRKGKTLYLVKAFFGRTVKPSYYYNYPTRAAREAAIQRWIDGAVAKAASVAQRRAKRNVASKLELGQVLYTSYGYDQTNIDYYQVTRIIGRCTVELTPIRSISSSNDGMWTGTSVPDIGNYSGGPMVKRVGDGNVIRIASYAWARVWDGIPKSWTAYA